MLRSNSKQSGEHHVVSPDEEQERLQWEEFAEKESFKPRMKEWRGDEIRITRSHGSVRVL